MTTSLSPRWLLSSPSPLLSPPLSPRLPVLAHRLVLDCGRCGSFYPTIVRPTIAIHPTPSAHPHPLNSPIQNPPMGDAGAAVDGDEWGKWREKKRNK